MIEVESINMAGTVDVRPVLEWEVPYLRLDASACSGCGLGSMPRTDNTVTKHRWMNRDLGQLITRCPDHQAAYEQTERSNAARVGANA